MPVEPSNRDSCIRSSILYGLLVPFTILTFLALRSGSPGDLSDRPVVLTTLATVTGPFVGAIARHGQSCCLRFSLEIAEVCGPVLALGLIAQVAPFPFKCGQHAVRLGLWTIGWLTWFLGGQVSFLHALS